MNAPKENEAVKSNFRSAKILVVEDNADHWTLMERAMQHWLSEVAPIKASSEDQTIAYLDSCLNNEWDLPKLILLDLYLPERENGWRLLKRIKGMPAPFNQIPVIMLSYSDQPEDITKAYENGISSYLVKPINSEGWMNYFRQLRAYWWETVTLPKIKFSV